MAIRKSAMALAALTLTAGITVLVAQTPATKPAEKAAVKPAEKAPPAPAPTPAPTPAPAPAPAPAPVADGKLKFEPVFAVGTPFFQQVTTDVEQTVKVQGGQEMKLKHSQTFFFKWEPLKIENKKTTCKLTIRGMKLKVDVANNPVNYDNTTDQPNANNPGLNDFLKNLVGSDFTVTFGENMLPEKVEGQENLLKNLGAANQQMEQLLKKILTNEAMKEMSDPLAGLTPGAPKGVGETWTRTSPLKLGPIGDYDRSLTFTYKGKDPEQKELERIEVTSKLTYKAPSEAADGLLFRIKGGELTTAQPTPGYFLYDAKTGLLVKSELKVTMTGSLKVAIGNTETTVNLNQSQTTNVQSSLKDYVAEKK